MDRAVRDRIVDVNPLDLLFARGTASMIGDVLIDGRTVIKDGNVVGVDLKRIEDELRLMYRKAQSEHNVFRSTWPEMNQATNNWFKNKT